MASTFIQPSFAGGEYSPSLYSRVDVARYSIGLRTCRNFIIHPQGGASNRSGFKYVGETKDSLDKKARIVRFVFNQSESYKLEFGEEYIRFYKGKTPIMDGAVPYEVETLYQEEDLPLLRFEGAADVIYITHPDYQTRILERYADDDWQLVDYESDDGPFMPINLDELATLRVSALTGDVTLSAAAAGEFRFSELHEGALFKLQHFVQGQTTSQAFGSTGASAAISCFTTWRVISHGTWTGKFRIEKSDDNGATWTQLRTFTAANDTNINTYGTEDIEVNTEPFLLRVNMYDYTSGTCNVNLSSDPFYQDGIVRIKEFLTDTTCTAAVLVPPASTVATIDWSEGSWSDFRGWPSVCKFHLDRLAFSNTYSEPMTTWLTQIGNYLSFFRHTTLLDSDGVSTPLPSRELNAVNGLVSLRKLVALTSASEWTIGPIPGQPFGPKSGIEQNVEGYRGSSGIEPEIIGNECVFVQRNGKVIRSLAYQFQDDGYVGSNLSVFAHHLFDNYDIVDMVYQQDPDSILWCLRSDGKLLGLTYMKEQEVIAWTWHDTEGEVESLCVVPEDGYDELWIIVKRENGRFIEYLTPRMRPDDDGNIWVKDQIFMDSAVSFAEGETVNAAHLAGQRVAILQDGEVLPQEDVQEDGSISITQSPGVVHVGLPYYSDLETLNIEVQTGAGTVQARRVKIGNVTFRVLNTAGGWIGPDENNIYEAFPALINEKLGAGAVYYDSAAVTYDDPNVTYDGKVIERRLYSGDLRLNLGAGYEEGGRVFYRQIDPLPVTIAAVIPEINVGSPAG
jgi:hypothetical protein